MLARQFRLPSSVSMRNSRTFRDEAFLMRFQKNNLPVNRYGFIVAKTIDKRAVVRNRLRRVVRSIIEEIWLQKLSGLDILFVLKPAIKKVSKQDLITRLNAAIGGIS